MQQNFVFEDYKISANYIKERLNGTAPKIAIILGSGLGAFGNLLEDTIVIDYKDIPNFPVSTTLSHQGKLLYGKLGNKDVLVMQGRCHFYEGYSMEQICFPIRVFSLLGIETLIISNASGGINENLEIGDLMIVNDHIKLSNDSPTRGKNIQEFGERFFDMSSVYDKNLIRKAKTVAKTLKIDIKQGVYAYMAGPQYETKVETNALKILGADVVGMSTVAEVISAAQCKMKVLCISLITNVAKKSEKPLTHADVTNEANKKIKVFCSLINGIINEI